MRFIITISKLNLYEPMPEKKIFKLREPSHKHDLFQPIEVFDVFKP